jgi:hypothetical protein
MLDTYNYNYITKISDILYIKYHLSQRQINKLMLILKRIMTESPQYIYHCDAEYWTKYIHDILYMKDDRNK